MIKNTARGEKSGQPRMLFPPARFNLNSHTNNAKPSMSTSHSWPAQLMSGSVRLYAR